MDRNLIVDRLHRVRAHQRHSSPAWECNLKCSTSLLVAIYVLRFWLPIRSSCEMGEMRWLRGAVDTRRHLFFFEIVSTIWVAPMKIITRTIKVRNHTQHFLILIVVEFCRFIETRVSVAVTLNFSNCVRNNLNAARMPCVVMEYVWVLARTNLIRLNIWLMLMTFTGRLDETYICISRYSVSKFDRKTLN